MSEPTVYLVVSDIELMGPNKARRLANMVSGEGFEGDFVVGMAAAGDRAREFVERYPSYGVTVFKVVEVEHFARRLA